MKNFLISLLYFLLIGALLLGLAGCEEPPPPIHSSPLGPSKDRPPHMQDYEPSLPLFDPGVLVECLDTESYDAFISQNPSPPTHFFTKERLAVLGAFESLVVYITPIDTNDYADVTITQYVYKLADAVCYDTFCFGITLHGEELLPTGTLPATELARVGTDALVSQNNVRRITNESGDACVIDLDGIRYTYGEDGNLEKIEWAYRGLLVSFSDFDSIPSDTLSTSTVSLLLRTPTLTREMADQLNQNLIATLFPTPEM